MITNLRDAALREMDAPQLNVKSVQEPSFDHDHDAENSDDLREFPQFQSAFNPHVGNGNGPIG